MEIRKPITSTDYIVDDKYWVDPQYETVFNAEGDRINRPDLVAAVRLWVKRQADPAPKNIEAEIKADVEYQKHYNAVCRMMEG